MGKQSSSKIHGDISDVVMIGRRKATTVQGAKKILQQRAKEEFKVEREYSRDAVYALFLKGKIEGVRTPSTNYYFLDSLMKVKLNPTKGRPQKTKTNEFPEA